MNTPIVDFVKRYEKENKMRMHMPGHKGKGCGHFKYDITEIQGADSLFEASGIIRESEENASNVFGAHTFYSTEGSSLSIRAMLYLCKVFANKTSQKCRILAARNVHKSFISACALLDIDVDFSSGDNYLECEVELDYLKRKLKKDSYTALFVTSPDYLGNIQPIAELAEITKECGTLFLVDNAHGAYLKFLEPSMHPIDLGADMCADSAHKTLSALTGAAYLHISKNAPDVLVSEAKNALSLFASTSPSYLIMASLDALNPTLNGDYKARLKKTVGKIDKIKSALKENGYSISCDEPMKITLYTKTRGYLGTDFAKMLFDKGIVCEFCDRDFVTFMPSVENTDEELDALLDALLSIKPLEVIEEAMPGSLILIRTMTIRDATLMPKEEINVDDAFGRVLATPSVACPPAVPIAIVGEVLDYDAIEAFKYYGVKTVFVTKKLGA